MAFEVLGARELKHTAEGQIVEVRLALTPPHGGSLTAIEAWVREQLGLTVLPAGHGRPSRRPEPVG